MITAILIIRFMCFFGLFSSIYLAFVAHQYLFAFVVYYFSGMVFTLFEFFRPKFELYGYRIRLTTVTLSFYSLIWVMMAYWLVVRKMQLFISGKRYVVWGHEGSNMYYFKKWKDALNFAKEKLANTERMFIQDLFRHTFIDGEVDNPMWYVDIEHGVRQPSKWSWLQPHPLIYVASLLVNSINKSDVSQQ